MATLEPPNPPPAGPSLRSDSAAPSSRRQETDDSDKAGRVWARQAEADAWSPCILTLDGGGIRGYSSLLILKELMHQIWLWENVLEDEERAAHVESGQAGISEEPKEMDQAVGGHDLAPVFSLSNHDSSVSPVHNQDDHDSDVSHRNRESSPTNLSSRKSIKEEDLLPCHYFDFMYGTSTGGLIATILGRLRMTVDEGLELYRKVGDDLFGRRRSSIPLRTKYYHQPLERAVREIVSKRCLDHPNCDGNDLHPWDADKLDDILKQDIPFDVDKPRVCQSCCLTATHDKSISEAYLLRSYPHYYSPDGPNWTTPYNQGALKLPIWQCTRATTAAPFYFAMVKAHVDGEFKAFKDGGIRENNPSGAALSEFHSLYYRRNDTPALMLSIGTGRPDQSKDGFAGAWGPAGHLPFVSKFLEKRAVIRNLLIKYTEGEKQHYQMREYAHGEHHWYKRLNVSDGLQNMPLDSWERGEWQGQANVPGGATLTKMEDATAAYLEREYDPMVDTYAPPSTMLRQTAEKLARQRRAREKEGGIRWEAFLGKHLSRRVDVLANDEDVG
ncbi:acyl transferase/acyl hydrolase/lysophospholipase [Neohortaea acidophila]|uniref:Acyl transferase/acyl hydrolase/lysophospholipase n=1 Tax=Neohortaea acidophila TaxID=245834 RepID=A0A6A6Q5A3_9PEZI|nr:acyl transferase/acyl hydrolase/lysophospholipase [Neohortaea acidophila]KAF2487154.1 acyl transferase/acyl hydrolase/lysophospholipase [Neohortaea acidophila]